MHYSLELKNILAINFRFITAWENRSFEWNDWARVDAFLREAKYQELVAGMSRRAPRPNAPAAPDGGDNPKKKGESSVNGVSADFLKENSLCINFNKGKCNESGTHKHPFIADKILYHQCGACKKSGKTDSSHGSHELDACTNKQHFRR